MAFSLTFETVPVYNTASYVIISFAWKKKTISLFNFEFAIFLIPFLF